MNSTFNTTILFDIIALLKYTCSLIQNLRIFSSAQPNFTGEEETREEKNTCGRGHTFCAVVGIMRMQVTHHELKSRNAIDAAAEDLLSCHKLFLATSVIASSIEYQLQQQ